MKLYSAVRAGRMRAETLRSQRGAVWTISAVALLSDLIVELATGLVHLSL